MGAETRRKKTEDIQSVLSFPFMIDGRCEQLRLLILLYSAALFEAIGCIHACARVEAHACGKRNVHSRASTLIKALLA